MLYILLQIWPWALGALALGAFTGAMAGLLSVQNAPQKKLPDPKRPVKEPVVTPAPPAPAATPEQIQALEKQLAEREASLAELRAGLDREVTLRRAAVARLEGMLVEQQAQMPPRPNKGNKTSAKSSPSQ